MSALHPRSLLLASTVTLGLVAASTAGAADATATLIGRDGATLGTVSILQGPAGLALTIEAENMPPGPKAIHIHGVGDCSDGETGFQASGGHVNPDGHQHGFLNSDGPDAGDLPNFHVHDDGTAWAQMFNERASLDGSVGAELLDADGAALVVHENPDDHMTQPIGGAGGRIACGVIEG